MHAQNKGRPEFGRDSVEIVIWRLITLHLAGLITVCAVQMPHPGAFDDLERLLYDHRPRAFFLIRDALFKRETAVFHFLSRRISGPAQFYGPFEILSVIGNEIDGAFSRAQKMLSRIGRVAAVQEHCVILLACYIIRLDQTVRTETGRSVLRQRADQHGRHREEQRCLVKIVHDSQILKAAHSTSFQ